jgi:hypothetical protein
VGFCNGHQRGNEQSNENGSGAHARHTRAWGGKRCQ